MKKVLILCLSFLMIVMTSCSSNAPSSDGQSETVNGTETMDESTESSGIPLVEEQLDIQESDYDFEKLSDPDLPRYIEDTVRNRVAHEMVGVSDEFIKAKVSYSSEEIVQMMQKVLFYLDGGLKKYWNSYDEMNECILERMETELARN